MGRHPLGVATGMETASGPLGAKISIFAPPMPIKHSVSSPVQRCLCHSLWCFAGGFSPTTSQKYAKSV